MSHSEVFILTPVARDEVARVQAHRRWIADLLGYSDSDDFEERIARGETPAFAARDGAENWILHMLSDGWVFATAEDALGSLLPGDDPESFDVQELTVDQLAAAIEDMLTTGVIGRFA